MQRVLCFAAPCQRCIGCEDALAQAMPCMTKESLRKSCGESVTFRQACVHCKEVHEGRSQDPISGHDGVRLGNHVYDIIEAKFDGYTRDDFLHAFRNKQPESEPSAIPDVVDHPITNERMNIWWCSPTPSFELRSGYFISAEHRTNMMPTHLYSDQPKHTMEFLRKNILPGHNVL